ncbi:outer membrane beta-barrel protein [Pedobacter duraquae]|uniref:Outer membrane receptor protein involved in Fe transport n=1 Tax=Pedobacter duraquae TaxID=425511 RepID=A0A4R6IDG6_9SPHI|nr:outer membrane beta-barrel protein [Pedobacter duraquae]TDO19974.1 outer membrane receptor protein involved in Fe transport [Pedobacter duraquae]
MRKYFFILLVLGFTSANAQEREQKTDTVKKDSLISLHFLDEVKVSTRKKIIERKVDRTIINIAQLANVAGIDVLDLLGKLPGLRVTDDGNINLMGKGVTVYVDGKLTYLSGNDLAAYLKSMPVDLLDKIELMPNPSAKYDAAGSGGVVNIITKKNKQEGYNIGAAANLGKGFYRKANGSVNMNYRQGKFNFFGNAGVGAPKDFENSSSTRRFLTSQGFPISTLSQENEITYTRYNSNLKLGADYYLNTKTTMGIIMNAANNTVEERGHNTNLRFSRFIYPDSSVISINNVNNRFRNKLLNLNITHQFDSLGSELSVDMDYGKYRTQIDQVFSNSTFSDIGLPTNNTRISGMLPRDITIYSAKADFSYPSKKGIAFNSGIKISKVATDNKAEYFKGKIGGEQPDSERSNHFRYHEIISAAYMEGYQELGEFAFKVGLRIEDTQANGHQLGNSIMPDSTFNRKYANLFPSLFISFKPDKENKHQFFLNFGRRIGRPGYDKLNPFLTLVQRYNHVSGNPFLQPDFTNNFELSHVFKEQLNTVAYYSDLSNISGQVIRTYGDVYVQRPENTGSLQITGLMITYNKDIFKWWNADLSVNPERIHMNVLLDSKRVDTTYYAHSLNWFNRLTIGKNCTAELVLNWGGRTFSGQNTTKGIAALRAGIRKQFFKGKATIGVSASDLFYSAITQGQVINVAGSDGIYRNRKDSRTVMLSLSYKMSRNAKDTKRPRDRNGARDEQNRVQTSPY